MTRFAVARGLTVRHIGRRAPALRDLDLSWEEGERLLLLGPSGSGKSTLGLCLDGVIPHALDAHWESGSVLVRGRDTRGAGLAATTRDVGIVFQDPEAQLVALDVDDEIAFGLENHATPREEMRSRINLARARMGLVGDRVPERVDRLSGGMKQRLALAGVLAAAQPGIVFDEPTANLDPHGAASVVSAMEELARDRARSLLIIEHRLDDLVGLVDRVAVLDADGHLALEGTPDDAFGARREVLDSLGVWVPQLTVLASLLGVARVPLSDPEAAEIVARSWPRAAEGPADATPRVGPAVLEARSVTYRFRGAPRPAIEDVSVAIRGGEIVAIVGRNGAGKSTLGLVLAGVLRPTAGAVLLDGRDVSRSDRRSVRARLAYVFQYPEHQFVARTVRDEVAFGLRARGIDAAEVRRRSDEALAQASLGPLAPADPHSLSVGQQRRLSVATALVTDPEVVLLDEPTFGQDRRHYDLLARKIDDLRRQGRTVVLITHDLALVADHAERVIAMADGHVVFDGGPGELFARADVLARCGLALPPVARVFRQARDTRPDLPAVIGLRDARERLGHVA